MLDGLEVTVLKRSEVIKDNDTSRIDPEYFKKEYLGYSITLEKIGFEFAEKFADVTDGIHASIDYDPESGIRLISATSPKENYFDFSAETYISQKQHLANQKTSLQAGDVIVSSVGTIGNSAVVDKSMLPANADRHVGVLRFRDTYLPYFVSTFLLTKYGRFQTLREATGNVQLNLFIYKLKTLKLPKLSLDFQKQIEKTVKSAHAKLEQSKRLYAEAEETLLEELGLKNWSPPKESISVKSFGESFDKFGRLDAEYFHPQKDYAFRWLSKHSGEPISKHFQSVREIYNPPAKDTGKSLQTFDLTHALNYFIEEGDVMSESEIGSTKKKIQHGDVVVSKLRSYLKEIAIVETEEESLGSSEFIVLRSDGKVAPELLMVYLRSQVVQTILQWSQDGSNHPRFQEEELLSIKLPVKAIAAQKKIQKLIQAGVTANQESKRLLELSKRAVESAIEKGESKALVTLNGVKGL